MKQLSTLLACLFLCMLAMNAAPVDVNTAQKTAQAFFNKKGKKLAPAKRMHKAPRSSKAATPAQEAAYYYVFNADNEQGYVIVSGDDQTVPVLGYADKGSFDEDNIPDNMKAWLKGYADQMEAMAARQSSATGTGNESRVAEPALRAVAPLLTSKWDQGAPYNDLCPTYPYTGEECFTGCVATAFAQVLYYYRAYNPTKLLKDIPAYTSVKAEGEPGISIDGVSASESVLDWGNMLDQYSGNETEAQKRAVATLMAYCGRVIKMEYGPKRLGGSSGITALVPGALVDYFGYDNGVELVRGVDCTISEWNNMIYQEIANFRPVFFAGASSGGGHAFVIDGFDGESYFHINWGWNGSSDGYYVLSVANPYGSGGIGDSASEDGYAFDQMAIVGIMPNNSQPPVEQRKILSANKESSSGNTVEYNFHNLTPETFKADCGLGYIDENGFVHIVKPWEYSPTIISPGKFFEKNYFTFTAEDFKGMEPGTYKLVPFSSADESDMWYECYHNPNDYVQVVYDGTDIEVTSFPINMLAVTDTEFTSQPVAGNTVQLNAQLSNGGSGYVGALYLFASTGDSKPEKFAAQTGVTVEAGAQTIASLWYKPAAAGTYNLWISTDVKGNDVIWTGSMEVLAEAPVVNYNLNTVDMVLENGTNNKYYDGKTMGGNFYGTHLKGTLTVENTGTEAFKSELKLFLFKYDAVDSPSGTSCDEIKVSASIGAGESKTIPFDFKNVEPKWYRIGVYNGNTELYTFPHYNNYALSAGIECSCTDGRIVALPATGSVEIPADAAAVNLMGVASSVTSIKPNANPNTLYYIDEAETAPAGLESANVVKGFMAKNITWKSGYSVMVPFTFDAENISYETVPSIGSTGTGGWQTIALPYDVSSVTADGSPIDWFRSSRDKDKDFWVRQFIGLDDAGTILFGNVEQMQADMPYIVAFPSDKWGEEYKLVGKTISFNGQNAVVRSDGVIRVATSYANFEGTLVQGNIGEYGYTLNADGSAFVRGTATIDPFSAFFALKDKGEAPARLNIAFSDETPVPTGITSIDNSQFTIHNSQFTIDNSQFTIQNEAGTWYTLDGQRLSGKPTRKGIYIHNGTQVVMK